jgi:hypothetical protein
VPARVREAGHEIVHGLLPDVDGQHARAGSVEGTGDLAADGAAGAGDEHGFSSEALHFGRLSMTRFALPIERSIVPMRTSALMPM